MRVLCPNCGAAYDVPEPLIGAGRMVRCARCARVWRAAANAATPPAAELVAPAPISVVAALPELRAGTPAMESLFGPESRSGERYRRDASSGAALAAAWVVSLAVIGAAGWAAWRFQSEIMAAWPPSIRLYAALGLVHG